MLFRTCLIVGLLMCAPVVAAKDWEPPMPVAQDLAVELQLTQDEIDVEMLIPPHNGRGGLLGMVMDGTQIDSINTRIQPIRALLVDYRFNDRFEQAMRAKLATATGIATHADIHVEHDPGHEPRADASAPIKFVVTPKYNFDYRLNKLMVQATVVILERDGAKMRERMVRHYIYNMPLDTPSHDNTARWTAMGAQGLSNLLEQGLQQVTDMVVHDFSATGRAEWAMKKKGTFTPLLGRRYEGLPVRGTSEWTWVRQPDTMSAKASRTQLEYPFDITGFQPLTGPVTPLPMPVATEASTGASL